jgi:DNA-binding CsgD family transcriptional regulator/PAS domain-containing protein
MGSAQASSWSMSVSGIEKFVSGIYDCAANPALWPDTLTSIRDHMNLAYAMVGFTDLAPFFRGQVPEQNLKFSPWDSVLIKAQGPHIQKMPGYQNLFNTEVDQPWVQMWECSEEELHATEFYNDWVKPQGLRDAINVPFFRRPATVGVVTAVSYEGRELFNEQEAAFVAELSPHIRRAVAISDMIDQNKHMMTLFKHVLDALSTAVFIIGAGHQIKYANAAAEDLLSAGQLLRRDNGMLTAGKRNVTAAAALEDALSRAAHGDSTLGIKGIGVPLTSATGERAAAYVLPISGKDVRGAMGAGFCSVFVAQRGEQLPMTIEVLRTIYDLTQAEARVASLIAKGDSAEMISEALGVSLNTVRTQIANSLTKTGTRNQTQLVAHIHELVPPLMS